MNAFRRWAILLALHLVAACQTMDVEPNEIVGRYRMNAGKAEDVLEILPGGHYVHSYRPEGEQAIVDCGNWELEEIEGRPHVAFHGFVHRYRAELGADLPQDKGIWPAPVEKSRSGKIRLSVNQDIGRYYERVGPVE